MMLGARTAAWAKSGPTAKDYVQDGLVAMWDGIEGSWRNIVGQHEQMEFVGAHQLRGDCVFIDGVSGAYGIVGGLSLGGNPTTQEFVLKIDNKENYGRVIAENIGLCMDERSSHSYRLYGFGADSGIGLNPAFDARHSVSLGIGSLKVDHLFVNGVSTIRYYAKVGNSTYPNSITFFNRTGGGRGITGELCCARIYNRVIFPAEIAHNYAIDKVRFNLP